MVKRRKEDDPAGVLEFEGRRAEDPESVAWLAEHKAQNGGKLRVSRGGTGVRVMFGEQDDLAAWKERAERVGKAKKAAAP